MEERGVAPIAEAGHSCPFHPGRVTAGRGEMNMQILDARIGELPFDCLFEPDAFDQFPDIIPYSSNARTASVRLRN